MSGKFAPSCASLRGATLGTGTNCSLLPAPCSYAHADNVHDCGNEEPDEPRPVVETGSHPGDRPTRDRGDKARQARRYAKQKRPDGDPVDSESVLVDAMAAIQVVDDELSAADGEIVGDHDAGDRPEQCAVTDEPGKDVRGSVVVEPPRHHHDSDDGCDHGAL